MPSPFGHALAGIAAVWCVDLLPGSRIWRLAPPNAPFFERAGGAFTLICAGLGAMPDLDLLFGGFHRSVSHSITAVIFVTILAVAVTRWVTEQPPWRSAVMCATAYATHLFLDWLAIDRYFPYGLQLFWPFSQTWFISGVDLFPRTARSPFFSLQSLRVNLNALLWETIILMPVVILIWLIRVKTLSRLAAQLAGRHHSS
jgi:membrane-bound metal-dependent hydrolase YbcI (DUF457 family)